MSVPAPVPARLTFEAIASYLEKRDVSFSVIEKDNVPILRMLWGFDMGDAIVLISIHDDAFLIHGGDAIGVFSRLEITWVTENQYNDRRQETLELLNARNRARAFSRSLDEDGNVWLEYIGLYPTYSEFPKHVFDLLFDGVMQHFEDDYATLEAFETETE
ncbi:MAG: YbjN domain-containing protein [Cytophagales bacterium]|nr:YbjN domain-containing protein [Armatimonadota bacterium]